MAKKSKSDRTQTIGWSSTEKRWWPVGIIAYLCLAIGAIALGPDWLVAMTSKADDQGVDLSAAERQAAVAAARQSVLLATGGGLALITLIVTVSRDAIARGRAQQEREEKISAQFTEAIGQLSTTESLSIRLGGIYALERIATDSKHHRLGALAVLTQYIREHGRAPEKLEDDRSVAPDVQTAAEVVTRLTSTETSPRPLSLDDANLFGVDLRRAGLQSWSLVSFEALEANLSGANLRNVKGNTIRLKGANLEEANLSDASLSWAYLEGARMVRVNAGRTDFTHASMKGVNLIGADLRSANLSYAKLRDALLNGTKLDQAELYGADLRGADLSNVQGATHKQLLSAGNWDEETIWPTQFKMPLTKTIHLVEWGGRTSPPETESNKAD